MSDSVIENNGHITYRVKITRGIDAPVVLKNRAANVTEAITTALEEFNKSHGPVFATDHISIKLKPE